MRLKMWTKFVGALVVLFALDAVLIFAPAFAPVPGQSAKSSAQTADNGKQETTKDYDPCPSLSPINREEESLANQPHRADQAKKDKCQQVAFVSLSIVSVASDYKGWVKRLYDWGPWAFAFLLVIVGGLQVRLLRQTRDEIKRQANTMQGQAQDAKEAGAHTETLALQAVRQSDLTQRQLELTHRPWIAIESALPASDLVFDERGGVLMLNIQIRNVGNSIAKHIINFVDYAVGGVTEMRDVTMRVIGNLKTPIPPELDHGKLLFPGQADLSQYAMVIRPEHIEKALKSGHFKDQKGIAFDLLVCYDYQSNIDPGIHHQTRCTFGVAKAPPGGGPLMGIFLPSAKVYPAQQMVFLYRGFGAHAD